MKTWDVKEKRFSKDTIIKTFKEVDIRDIEIPIIAIYYNAEDYKGKYAARLFIIDEATKIVLVKDSLEEVRADIKKNCPNLVRFDRSKEDVLSLLETWL